MASKMRRYEAFLYWFPPILWMAIIFYMSSRSRIGITSSSVGDFFIFKTLHATEYAFLYLLVFRAFHSIKTLTYAAASWISVVVCILYAFSDEIHQLFIASREGRVRDILIDACGIIIMYSIMKRWPRLFRPFL